MHQLEAQRLDLDLLNKLFNEQFHIPFDLSGVSEAAAKVIGYCCFHTAMIFRQIKQPLPTMIGIEKVAQKSGEGITIARCFWGNRTFPIRAVTFNSLYDWENAIVNAKSTSNENGYHSSYHFYKLQYMNLRIMPTSIIYIQSLAAQTLPQGIPIIQKSMI